MKALAVVFSLFFLVSIASAGPIVVIVRHAEKAENDPKDPDLSPAGRERAKTLARILKDANVSAIFTTELKRTQETAAPTAAATGVAPTIVPGKDSAAVVSKLHEAKGNALVVGHGNTIPDIVKALGIERRSRSLTTITPKYLSSRLTPGRSWCDFITRRVASDIICASMEPAVFGRCRR